MSTMDKEQFYTFMNAMSPADIQECLQRVLILAKIHTLPIDIDLGLHLDTEQESSSELKRLQVSRRVWFQHALMNKFNAREASGNTVLKDLGRAAVELFSDQKVVDYIVKVNKNITQELNRVNDSGSFSTLTKKIRESESHHTRLGVSQDKNMTPSSTVKLEDEYDSSSDLESLASDSGSDLEGVRETNNHCAGVKRKRKTRVAPTVWTEQLDAKLFEVVSIYKHEGWATVAEQMGNGITAERCSSRWFSRVKHKQQGLRDDNDWTQKEESALTALVAKHTVHPEWSEKHQSMIPARIDWNVISTKIGRVGAKCQYKWRKMMSYKDKVEPY